MKCISTIEEVDLENTDLLEAQSLLWIHTLTYIKSMCLKCVVELRIPDAIDCHGKPTAISDLISSLSIPESKSRSLRSMMRPTQHIFESLITLSGDKAFDLTPISRLLTSSNSYHFDSSPVALLILHQHHGEACTRSPAGFINQTMPQIRSTGHTGCRFGTSHEISLSLMICLTK